MADTRNIVIELKLKNSNGGNSLSSKSTKGDGNEEFKANLTTLLHPVKTMEKNVSGKNIVVNQAYQYAKSAIKQMVMYEINKYYSLTENYKAQQDMSNALATIGKVSNFGSTVAAGAITGAAGGPVGAAFGAIVAAVGYAANEGIQTYQRFEQQNRNLATMNVQSSFQLTRMGLIDGGRGSYN